MIFRPSMMGIWARSGGIALPEIISGVAGFGDSITEQNGGSSGLYTTYANGPIVQARARMGSNWNWVTDAAHNKLTFATGGKSTNAPEFAAHLADVIASSADMVIEGFGLNDAVQSIAASTVAANRLAAWLQIRTAGKWCIPLAVVPMPTAADNNGAGTVSARIVAINAACSAAAAANGFPYVDVSTPLEASPGSNDGIGDLANFDGTIIHPNVLGCQKMGQALATYLLANHTFGIDPFNMGGTNIQSNGNFAAGATRPTGWTPGAPTNGSLGAETKSTSGGYNWWRIVCNKGTSTQVFYAQQLGDDGTSEGVPCDAIAVVRVISGTLDTLQLTSSSTQPGVVTNSQDFASGSGMAITSADGILYLRPEKKIINGAATLTWPQLIWKFVADGTIEIGYMSCRRFAA
jgi:lysophospholipase L1-like esterase